MRPSRPAIVEGLAPVDQHSALQRLVHVEATPGTVLITEEERDCTLVFVERGKLEVTDHGAVVGHVGAGGLVGEMALFTNGVRRATVTVASPASLWVLAPEDFDWLRSSGHPLAWAIEEQALRELVDRHRRVLDRLVDAAPGAAVAQGATALAAAFRSGRTFRPGHAGRVAVLRASPLFDGAPDSALEVVAERVFPCGAASGQALFEEGDLGDALYFLDSGSVELLVATRGGRKERAALLEAGDAFGSGAVVRVGEHRRYTALARSRVTAVGLDKVDWAELGARGDAVGSALRVAIIRAVVAQLDCANETLAATPGPNVLRAAQVWMDAHAAHAFQADLPDEEG